MTSGRVCVNVSNGRQLVLEALDVRLAHLEHPVLQSTDLYDVALKHSNKQRLLEKLMINYEREVRVAVFLAAALVVRVETLVTIGKCLTILETLTTMVVCNKLPRGIRSG